MSAVLTKALRQIFRAYRQGAGTTLTQEMLTALCNGPLADLLKQDEDARAAKLAAQMAKQLAMRRELRERIKALREGAKPVITNKLAKAIRQARLDGMTYAQIAEHLRVSFDTARRYGSDVNREKMQAYERARHHRLYNDPEWADRLEKKRAGVRAYNERQRAERDKSV